VTAAGAPAGGVRPGEGAAAAPRKGSLLPRLLSAFAFIPLLVWLVLLGGWPYLLLLEAVVILGLIEFHRLCRTAGASPHAEVALPAGALLVMFLYQGHTAAAGFMLTGFFLLALVLELFRERPGQALANLGATAFGVFYVGWLGSHLGLLRTGPPAEGGGIERGAAVVLFTFLVTWAGDSGAFFVGRSIGRRRLIPKVSPGKTVEGAIGGLLGSVAAGVLGALFIAPFLGTVHGAVMGALAGIVGPLGDLVESLLKRGAGLKDTAQLIPGHGGVLDRFDSLLFVAPVFHYYLKYMVFQG
jgi:phosphatidate cytidylyltransferase